MGNTEYRINQRTQTQVWIKTATSLGNFIIASIRKKNQHQFFPYYRNNTGYENTRKWDWLHDLGVSIIKNYIFHSPLVWQCLMSGTV